MENAFLMHPSWSSIHLMQWLGTAPSLRNRIFTWLITWGLWDCHCKEIPHFCSLALCSKENYSDFSVSLFFLSLSPSHLTEFKLILNNFNYSLNILTSCGVTFVFLSLECLPPSLSLASCCMQAHPWCCRRAACPGVLRKQPSLSLRWWRFCVGRSLSFWVVTSSFSFFVFLAFFLFWGVQAAQIETKFLSGTPLNLMSNGIDHNLVSRVISGPCWCLAGFHEETGISLTFKCLQSDSGLLRVLPLD